MKDNLLLLQFLTIPLSRKPLRPRVSNLQSSSPRQVINRCKTFAKFRRFHPCQPPRPAPPRPAPPPPPLAGAIGPISSQWEAGAGREAANQLHPGTRPGTLVASASLLVYRSFRRSFVCNILRVFLSIFLFFGPSPPCLYLCSSFFPSPWLPSWNLNS